MLGGGARGGPFPYVFTIVLKCILSLFRHFYFFQPTYGNFHMFGFFWLLVVKLQSLNGINGIKLIKYNSLLMISGPVGCSLHGLIV